MQYNLVRCEKVCDVIGTGSGRSYVGRGCSDGMWRVVVVTYDGAVSWHTLVAAVPPGSGSSTGKMRRKR